MVTNASFCLMFSFTMIRKVYLEKFKIKTWQNVCVNFSTASFPRFPSTRRYHRERTCTLFYYYFFFRETHTNLMRWGRGEEDNCHENKKRKSCSFENCFRTFTGCTVCYARGNVTIFLLGFFERKCSFNNKALDWKL